MPGWISQLLGFTHLPVGAAILFAACKGLGHWLEREADDEWRNAARQYLQGGRWFSGAVSTLLASRILFTRIYGGRYFSLLALWRCTIITVSASVGFLLFQMWVGENRVKLSDVFFVRMLLAIPFDYVSTARVRVIFAKIERLPQSLRVIIFSFLSDVVLLAFIVISLESLLLMFVYITAPIIEFERPMFAILTAIQAFPGIFLGVFEQAFISRTLFDPARFDAAFIYAALIPSLIFYLYCLSVLVAKAASMFAPLVTWTSGHLRFRKPFQTIFNVGGGMLAGFWVLGALLVEYL
jgi:hypothetical protein